MFVFFQRNFIQTWDHIFFNLFPSREDTFFKVGRVEETQIVRSAKPEGLLEIQYFIHHEDIRYTRHVYNLVMLLEEVGGMIMMLTFLLSLLLSPLAKFSFNIKATKELFYVRTSEPRLLKHQVQRDEESAEKSKEFSDWKFEMSCT